MKKFSMKKAAAIAMALTMCVPFSAFAAEEGSFTTSFDVYSPKLTVSVPVNLDVRVNPIADSSDTGVGQFSVASNSIDIINASVDLKADTGIPVVVTVRGTITNAAEDVVTSYTTFNATPASAKKKVFLQLSEAKTAATVDATNAAFVAGTEKYVDVKTYAINTAANYTAATNVVTMTKYGSLLSYKIAAPTSTDTTQGATLSTLATAITPGVGSFAVTGVANPDANWRANDVAVNVAYSIKAGNPTNTLATPKVTVPAVASAAANDLSFDIPGIGEADVIAMGIHNDDSYKDVNWAAEDVKVEYDRDNDKATVTVAKGNAILSQLGEDDFKTKPQDLVIGLSDGRMIVTTLTVTAK